ncbi:MAG TPA: heavy metal translocating P-type ATPase [Burkholderiales bacterium]|nr:heavy metal translocating P-type ATPase [Burkholderiales bacterium]
MARTHLAASEQACYHCGLLVPVNGRFFAVIDGERQPMCCAGCQAVAEAIAGNGLSSYYRTRTVYPPRAEAQEQRERDALALYDRPEVQAGFVRRVSADALEATLILEGITCAACIWLNEQHLSRLPGVLAVQVNYATRRAVVRWDERAIRLSDILAQVAAIGYKAWPATGVAVAELARRETRAAQWRLFVAAFGMMQVMMYAVPAYLAAEGTMGDDIRLLMRLASLVLTVPVVFYSAAPFFQAAWRDLRRMRLGMDVPVALGIGAAFAASVVATFTGGGAVYFDSITMFVFFLLCARYLEMRARQKAAASLEYLDKALPTAAHRLTAYPAGMESEDVPAVSLQSEDCVMVRPGESFPADGRIAQGETDSDESLLTGESRPVRKRVGDEVTGGAINRTSPVVVEVERVGDQTRISAIRRLVERASAQRPRINVLTDRVAGWFVAAVIVIAAGSALVWLRIDAGRALWVAVAVLVVTCPCALSLATPAALTVAVGRLARRGVILARGHAIETLAEVTHVVFDKTGTLTEGRLTLSAAHTLGGMDRDRCVGLAAVLESYSEHPIGAALRMAAPLDTGADMARDVRNLPGAGLEASIAGTRYRIGTRAFVSELAGTPVGAQPGNLRGATRVWLGREREWLACFDLSDRVRPDAQAALDRLREEGRQLMILSGDAASAVEAVARRLGVAAFEAGLTPEDKQARVQALQREGATVAMVGDGINDAPVLAQAHLAVAMGSGALLPQAHADIVLLSGRLSSLIDAFDIARETWRIVQQNLVWALSYNAIALPLAVTGLITPWMAGVGMGASSLLVVLNALRLARSGLSRGRTPHHPVTADKEVSLPRGRG